MATDVQVIKDADQGLIESVLTIQQPGATNANALAVIAQKRQREMFIDKTAADGAAATATTDVSTPWRRVPFAGKVVSITIMPSAALTGDPTNNAILTFSKRDAAGANLTTVGVLTTTVSWVLGTAVNVPLTAANVAVVAGGSLSFAITKGGTGVVVPISSFSLVVEDT